MPPLKGVKRDFDDAYMLLSLYAKAIIYLRIKIRLVLKLITTGEGSNDEEIDETFHQQVVCSLKLSDFEHTNVMKTMQDILPVKVRGSSFTQHDE